MVTITETTLRQNIYETIYDILTAANLLGGSVTVTAAYIDDNKSFPQVVINPPNIVKEQFSFNKTKSSNIVLVYLDIWTKKNKEKDQITDEIDALNSLKQIDGLSFVGWEESNAFEAVGGSKVHLKTITLKYRY